MLGTFKDHLQTELAAIRQAGMYKDERLLVSPQESHIKVADGGEVLNMCANNYLGLADHPNVITAAHQALDRWGYGLASVRFICGTQQIHKELEGIISKFLGTEDTILYSSCFDANGGLFETLLGPDDAVISDQLNHASIIDGIRLCKASRYRYKNSDMSDLAAKLTEAKEARFRLVATDGVFSMDGSIANLPDLCDLAEQHDAMVMVDNSHAVGVVGTHGRGTHEHHGVIDRVDVITGTLGKALGGASGGYTSGHREIIEMLRQRSRPYLFSNSLAPMIAATSMKTLEILSESNDLLATLRRNAQIFRDGMQANGFDLLPGVHPIIPIMLGDAALAQQMAARMLEKGVYVIGFSFPVVPKGQARIRVQVSAAHTEDDLQFAVDAFAQVKQDLGL